MKWEKGAEYDSLIDMLRKYARYYCYLLELKNSKSNATETDDQDGLVTGAKCLQMSAP